jgi:hypothetical protein
MAEGERFFLRPDRPVEEMTEDELDEFASELARRVKGLVDDRGD